MKDELVQLDPNVWGPPLWDLLFSLAFKSRAPAADWQVLFGLLEKVIPCQQCRRSYSIYRKQVQVSNVRDDIPYSAALWLWTIHDMVNQKLGKICISYDKLEKRHKATSMITHDFLIVDVFCMLALTSKGSHVKAFIEQIVKIMSSVQQFFKLPSAMIALSEIHLIDDLYTVYRNLNELYDRPSISRLIFTEQYAHAYA